MYFYCCVYNLCLELSACDKSCIYNKFVCAITNASYFLQTFAFFSGCSQNLDFYTNLLKRLSNRLCFYKLPCCDYY